jgi:uncharacterized protein YxjI
MRYLVRQKFFSLGDSFAIKDEAGNDVFIVRSQLLSFGKKLRIFDLLDNELCYIEQKLFKFMPEYDIFIAGNHTANVKKKFTFLKHDFVITSTYGNYDVEGDFWAHEFEISKNNSLVARISKQFFAFTDTYGVDIDDAQDQISNLALAIVVDMVCHDRDR